MGTVLIEPTIVVSSSTYTTLPRLGSRVRVSFPAPRNQELTFDVSNSFALGGSFAGQKKPGENPGFNFGGVGLRPVVIFIDYGKGLGNKSKLRVFSCIPFGRNVD